MFKIKRPKEKYNKHEKSKHGPLKNLNKRCHEIMDLFKGFKIKCCYPFSLNIFYVRKVVYFYSFLYEYFERKNEIKYIKLNIYHQICTLQQYLTLKMFVLCIIWLDTSIFFILLSTILFSNIYHSKLYPMTRQYLLYNGFCSLCFKTFKVDPVFCGVILYCKTLNSFKFVQDSFTYYMYMWI